MSRYEYLPSDGETVRAVFSLLGGGEQVLLCVAPEGHVLWLTDAAADLLDLHPMSPVAEAFSEQTAQAVLAAARDGAWLDLDEEIEDVLYRLRSHPVRDGLLLLAEPYAAEPPVTKTEYIRSFQETGVLGHMMNLADEGCEHAQDEAARERWERMSKLARRARRIHLHSEIVSGVRCLDERLAPVDLAALCRETAEAAADIISIPVTAPEGTLQGVMSREVFQFILLNLLSNAAACAPAQIVIGLRHTAGHIYLEVSDNAAALEPERIGALFSGWRGSIAGCSEKELAGMGLGLPAVQRLLSKWGGSLLARVEDDSTRFIAVFPDDLPEDPWEVRQAGISSGISDLIALELSVL